MSPTPAKDRIGSIDIIRGLALFGVLTINLLRATAFGLLLCLIGRIVAALTVWFPSQSWYADHVRQATDVYATVGYIDYVRYSVTELGPLLPLHLLVLPRTVRNDG